MRLSDGFLQDEIIYYTLNLDREKPAGLSRDVLACLRTARASHVLDWGCFKTVSKGDADLLAGGRHLPWMSPPFGSDGVKLTEPGCTNLPQLQLVLHWSGHPVHGSAQMTRRKDGFGSRKEGLAGDTILLTSDDILWGLSAEMRLQAGGQTAFEKSYPQDALQRTYVSVYERPAERTMQRVLQDLDTGLKPKPEPPPPAKGKKLRRPKAT